MAECPICKEQGQHRCPICKHKYCENHLTSHDKYCNPKKLPKVRNYSSFVIIPIAIFVLLVGFLLIIGLRTGEFSPRKVIEILIPEPELEQQVEYESVPIDIIFNYNSSYYNNELFYYGYLRKQKVGIGYINYLVDDHGNKISLYFNNPESKDIFDNSNPGKLYEITGILKEKHLGQVLQVNSVKETERPTKQVQI